MLWGCQAPEHPGSDDAAGMLDPTRISCEEDARPQENILGGEDAAGIWIFFGASKENQPRSMWLCPGQQGLHGRAQPGDFTLGCRRLLEGNGPAHPLKSASEQGERALPASFLRALGRSPAGTGISGLLPELLKAPWVLALLCCSRR